MEPNHQYLLSNVPYLVKKYSTVTLCGHDGLEVPTLAALKAQTVEVNRVQWGVLSQLFLEKIKKGMYIRNVSLEGTHQREIVFAQLYLAHCDVNELEHAMNGKLPQDIDLRTYSGIQMLFGSMLLLAGIASRLSAQELQDWTSRIDAVIPANAASLCVAQIRSENKPGDYPYPLGYVIEAWDALKLELKPEVRASVTMAATSN